jgi:predicted HAD superfamily Cof-like phosphohydrolase
MSNKNNSDAVREFTEGANEKPCPSHPMLISKEQVMFIIRMVFSELDELATTVTANPDERDAFLQEALATRDKCIKFNYSDEENSLDRIANQADSMVDAWYYMLNVAGKHGMNLSKLFDVVHDANMAKRDPATGKFLRRKEDNKIIKPAGWTEPDIIGAMRNQVSNGSWK